MEKVLEIQNITVRLEEKELIQDFSLTVQEGEVHALMGPNGAGKSSLTKALAGHPLYKVKQGKIFFYQENLLPLSVESRAAKGIFVSFQETLEIPALKNFQFFFSAYNALKKAERKKTLSEEEFFLLLQKKMDFLQLPSGWEERAFNEGFSGGEKKKNELLQLLLFEPKLAVLDEIDSGLDVDAVKKVKELLELMHDGQKSFLLITHYPRLLEFFPPDYVHIIIDGKLVTSGKKELLGVIEKEGYDFFKSQKI